VKLTTYLSEVPRLRKSGVIPLLRTVLSGLVRGIVSRDSVDGVKTHRSVGRILMGGGGETSRTHPDRPWGPPSLLYSGYRE